MQVEWRSVAPTENGSGVSRAQPDGGGAGGGPPEGDPRTGHDTETLVDVRLDRLWNVIIWNDPINLMTYVTYVIQRLFGYPLERARRLMLQVHNEGRSIVASCERERAEYYVGRLHGFGLQATLEKQPAG